MTISHLQGKKIHVFLRQNAPKAGVWWEAKGSWSLQSKPDACRVADKQIKDFPGQVCVPQLQIILLFSLIF